MPPIESLRKAILELLGKPILAEYDATYPECVCLVVLGDVGPERMRKVLDLLRAHEGLRLCANIIEKQDAGMIESEFKLGGFKAAWESSWHVSVATVRLG